MKHLWMVALLLCAAYALVGCGGDGNGNGVKTSSPTVSATFPANGATGVSLNTSISITFSEDMDETTLDSIYVSGMTIYRIEYDGALNKVTAYIDSLLEPETSYEVTVSSYCMDKQGENLAADHTFGFTTGVFGCDGLDDPFYSNKSIASAGEIVLNRRYKLLPSCGGAANMHYFKFTLDEATKITAYYKVVYADTSRLGWVTYFLRADGQDYAGQGAGPIVADRCEYQFARSFLPGTYYINTGETNYTGHTAVFEFLLATSEPCEDDMYEDNDFFDEATPVSEGDIFLRGCSLDKDFFSIDLSAGQTLVVTLDCSNPTTELHRIVGYNAVEQERGYYQGYANPSSITLTATASETHYVEVFWWNNDMTYSLNFNITGP